MSRRCLPACVRNGFASGGRRLLAAALLVTQIAACNAFRIVNEMSPSEHYQRTADLAYGSGERQTLDIYMPRAADGPAPLVVFFYGGGWKNGDKKNYEFVASSLTDAGYAVVIPDYRLYPSAVFPAFVEDGAAAVAWVLKNAARFGALDDEFFIMGHSAGAHIAALLSTDGRYLAAHGVGVQRIRGLVGLSGPYDFLPIESGYLRNVFPEATRAASQPVNFVTADAPPALLIHGADDELVDPSNSERFAERLIMHGVPVTLKLYDDTAHARVAAALAPPLDFTGDTLADTLEFLSGSGK